MLVYMAISNEIFLKKLSVWFHDAQAFRHYFFIFERVVAIDQRGYGLSSKPSSIGDYKVELLARDVADVVEQLG